MFKYSLCPSAWKGEHRVPLHLKMFKCQDIVSFGVMFQVIFLKYPRSCGYTAHFTAVVFLSLLLLLNYKKCDLFTVFDQLHHFNSLSFNKGVGSSLVTIKANQHFIRVSHMEGAQSRAIQHNKL